MKQNYSNQLQKSNPKIIFRLPFLMLLFLLGIVGNGWGQNAAIAPGNIVACNTTIYDRGGSTGNYANSTNEWITIAGIPGATITISGTYALETCNCDYIYIRNGYGNTGTILQTKTNGSGSISYTGTAGQALTVHLTSDGSSVAAGFALTVTYSYTTSPSCATSTNVSGTAQTNTAGTNIVLKDHAGDNTSYNNSRNDYIVLNNVAGTTINISGFYNLESGCSCDYLKIYSGSGTGGTLLTSFTNGNGTVNYTGTAGTTLTLQFTSDAGTVSGGFALFVSYTPIITTSGSLSAFTSCAGSVSTSQTFNVVGSNLQAGITVTAPTGFEVSADNITFSNNITVGSAATIASTPVYVRLSNTATGSPSGNITCSSTNASSKTVAVSGTVNTLPTVSFTVQPGASACVNTDVTYTTQSSQTNYVWTVPGVLNTDYSITSGGIGTSSNSVTLKWLTSGSKTVTVNYKNAAGCSAVSATSSTATNVLTISTPPVIT
ncbi:MAG: hypothetical protein FGM14_16855 [Flavobacteriales bacterium]|nr:hypothetical protein [Flavobacteriales bacterium]